MSVDKIKQSLANLRQAHDWELIGLKEALAKGEADLTAGRFTTIGSDEELVVFFAKL